MLHILNKLDLLTRLSIIKTLSTLIIFRPNKDSGSFSKRRLNLAWKISLIVFLVFATLSIILWTGLQLVAHQDKYTKKEETQELLKKFETLEKKENMNLIREAFFQKKLEELEKKSVFSLPDLELKLKTDADENTAKIEILQKLFNSSNLQTSKLQQQLEDLANASVLNSNIMDRLDNATKISEAELWNRIIIELKNRTNIREIETVKEIQELQNKSQDEIEGNKLNVKSLEKQNNISEINEIIEQIAFLQKKVIEHSESLHTINQRLGNTTAYLAIHPGILIKCFLCKSKRVLLTLL